MKVIITFELQHEDWLIFKHCIEYICTYSKRCILAHKFKVVFATSWLAVLAVCGYYNLLTIFSIFHSSYIWDKIVLKMENSMKNQVTLAQAVFDRMLYFLITVKKLR